MSRGLRRVAWALVAVAVAAFAAYVLRPKPVPVTVARVARQAMRVTLDEEGEVRAYARYVVTAPVAGRLLRVALRAGDRVRRGTVIARVAPVPLSAREREEQVARVAAAEAVRREAEERVHRAEAARAQAARDRLRAEELADKGFVPRQSAEQSRLAETTAEEEVAAARYRVASAAAEVEAARAGLIATRADGPAGLVDLRAPATGAVLRVHEESERVVAAGTPVLTLGDPSRFEVVVDYLSSDAVRIRAGMPMLLAGWGGPGAIRARVRLVEPGAFTKVSALGVEEQRVNVAADFVDAPGPLGDGYRVDARVVLWESPSALTVPASSLFRSGEGWAAFVVGGGRARMRAVEVGQRNAELAEVLGGLAEGEVVVRHPPSALGEGARVTAP